MDVLERAARRGIDVRILFWRPDSETASLRTNAFWGSPAHFEALAQLYPSVNIRWDRAYPGFCQHQKTWLIDPVQDSGSAFVGGINLNPHSLVRPNHRGAGHNHDVYVEVMGPAVADVQHNFVQRWNGASERDLDDGRWGRRSHEELVYPDRLPPSRGSARVQIQRTTHADLYHDDHPAVESLAFPIHRGEMTNLHQYEVAIRSAQRTIYLEHQYLDVVPIIEALEAALARGVRVVAMLPAVPVVSNGARTTGLVASRARLSMHEHFTLAGMAGQDVNGARVPVYVHSKLMLIDDEWASVGSCNLHHYSVTGNGELNAAYHDSESVRAMRVELFQEHLGVDTNELQDTAALDLFQQVARANRRRYELGDPAWDGMAIALDANTYGEAPQLGT